MFAGVFWGVVGSSTRVGIGRVDNDEENCVDTEELSKNGFWFVDVIDELYCAPVAIGLERNELWRELFRESCSDVGSCSGKQLVCCTLELLSCANSSDSYGFKIVGGAETFWVDKNVCNAGFGYGFVVLDVRSGGGAYFKRRWLPSR